MKINLNLLRPHDWQFDTCKRCGLRWRFGLKNDEFYCDMTEAEKARAKGWQKAFNKAKRQREAK